MTAHESTPRREQNSALTSEPEGLHTFRMGLFGLDKMGNIPETVSVMETALDAVLSECGHVVPDASKVA